VPHVGGHFHFGKRDRVPRQDRIVRLFVNEYFYQRMAHEFADAQHALARAGFLGMRRLGHDAYVAPGLNRTGRRLLD